jgi:hypothetical protein
VTAPVARVLAPLLARLRWRGGLQVSGRAEPVPRADAEATLAGWVHDALFIPLDAPQDGWFVAQLEERTLGATCLEGGFVVSARVAEGAWVKRDGVRLWLPRAQGVMSPPSAKAGARVRVRLPCARELSEPGAYTVVARAGPPSAALAHAELFVAATTEGCLGLVEGLLVEPALKAARFVMRVATTPAQREGSASLTLEVAPAALAAVCRWVTAAVKENPRWVRPARQALARPLGRGVSVASAPARSSFPLHRSRLIARGVLAALEAGAPWEPAVARAFAEQRLDWRSPWRGPEGVRPMAPMIG